MIGDYEFSRKDVEGLAKQLEGLSQLTERERSLLLAVFTAAREHLIAIPAKGAEDQAPTGVGFSKQILDAFIPDLGNVGDIDLIVARISPITPIKPTPIKPPPPSGSPAASASS